MISSRPLAGTVEGVPRPLSARSERAIALAGAALVAGVVAIGVSGPASDRRAAGVLAAALIGGVAIAVEIYALKRDETDRVGRLLVMAGFAWAPVTLALSPSSLPYSIGRVWAWLVLGSLIYLLLAFPQGRLTTRAERLVVSGAALVIGCLYLPSALVTEFPLPSPWSGCTSGCPANAFNVVQIDSGLTSTLTSSADLLAALTYACAALIIASRCIRGSRVARLTNRPVLFVVLVHFLAAAAFLVARRTAPDAAVTEDIGLVSLFAIPAVVLALLAGLIRWRLVAHGVWAQLA